MRADGHSEPGDELPGCASRIPENIGNHPTRTGYGFWSLVRMNFWRRRRCG